MDTTNKKTKNTRISLSTVKSYGFTDKLIRELLPEPELVTNPHYRSGPKMKLWDASVVESAMKTEIFVAEMEKRNKRREAAKKAVQTKTSKLQLQVDEFIKSVKISRIPLERLRSAAIRDKQKWYDLNGIYDKFAEDADDSTVKRWMVNYIRHNMVEYDQEIDDMKGKTGKSLLYFELHNGVLHRISEVYPELEDECLRQIKCEFR
nr:MAG TPA: DNA repair protein RAD14/DNA Complex excision repair DNA damage [Caudoviricetes sp.]